MQQKPTSKEFDITPDFQPIIQYDSGPTDPERIIVMGDTTVMAELKGPGTWVWDSTFDAAPLCFSQLSILRKKINNGYPSMLYALLPNKTDRTYERIVAVISELVPEASPSKILLDFEQGPIKHFQRGFPEAVIAL